MPTQPRREPRGAGFYVVLCLVLVLAGGVAVLAFMLRDRPQQVAAARPEVVPEQTPGKAVNRVDGTGAPPGVARQPDAPAAPADAPANVVAPAPPEAAAPSDAPIVPAPIPQGSERATKGPQSSAQDPDAAAPADQAPAAPQPDGVAPSDAPVIAVSQRAGMLVDAPDDPQKVKTFSGSVVWRIESVSAGQGQPLSNAVRAEIDIPEAKVTVSMVIKKNLEPQFPASHTIEFHFTEEPGNSLGPVKQINVPELRQDDSAPTGDPLVGVPVSITDDYFLVGLSRGGAEQTNLALMTQRNWFDVSILLTSGKVAKVAFEKGPTGQKILDDAIASWR